MGVGGCGSDPVAQLLLVPPLPQLRLHHTVEVPLRFDDQLIGAVVPIVPPPVLAAALLRAAAFLQAELPLSGLQDLLPLGLSFQHLQKWWEAVSWSAARSSLQITFCALNLCVLLM